MFTIIYNYANGLYSQITQQLHYPHLYPFLYEEAKKIQEVTMPIFSSLSASFQAFNDLFNCTNNKVIAMISCVALIAILALSLLRKREPLNNDL